jgi:hypothetical protein
MMTDITHRARPAQLLGTVSDCGDIIIITEKILDVKIYGFKIFCGNCRGIFLLVAAGERMEYAYAVNLDRQKENAP